MLDYRNTTTELAESNIDTAVISVGATEQFGPYLPMHIDSLIAERYANEYGKAINAYVLPVLPFNTSEEHAGFKGTVTVSPNILTAFLEDIIENLRRQGFKKFLLCSGHGGAYWFNAFIKHMNYKYPDIIVIFPGYQREAWELAVNAAGLNGRNDMHGGLTGVCTAMWLCPELVKLETMGSEIPEEYNGFADYIGWDKLTKDGNWGHYTTGEYTREELAKKGETLWMTLINKQCEGLKEYLEEAYRRKVE
ncbi:creatininase family protein [Paenibacillus monticola]|uniref:Creatininase family protein n=1 Tax=Paenibacillus monticola TaxID=2666075 RepID=A0A7X2HBF3_9BACL|nr:creatininase family protein [Paenibacillus monticola]MRN56997.1 creatininase family protein [Paenibacillus monticola]